MERGEQTNREDLRPSNSNEDDPVPTGKKRQKNVRMISECYKKMHV